ncbi:CRISPR-associated RAMP protein Csx7 [Chloroflexota bacterium]
MMVQDFSAFYSRFQVMGVLTAKTAMRIGAGSNRGAAEQDLPVLKDLTGRPYIPGSSFKGAYRAHLEQLLRSFDSKLACISVPREEDAGKANGCLTQGDVTALKDVHTGDSDEVLTQAILDRMCWVCRLCGAPWFASKLMIRDMPVVEQSWFNRYLIRDGVAIDRDTETAANNLYFNFEAIPAGTQFKFEVMIDNANEAELGLALLGLREFENGFVSLGGARSRGLGHVELKIEWGDSVWVTRENLKAYLLDPSTADTLADETLRKGYWAKFVAHLNENGGQPHA